jgi:hypothetical protein
MSPERRKLNTEKEFVCISLQIVLGKLNPMAAGSGYINKIPRDGRQRLGGQQFEASLDKN